jgi:hypothetical protein
MEAATRSWRQSAATPTHLDSSFRSSAHFRLHEDNRFPESASLIFPGSSGLSFGHE